ncbi:MAG: ABC transporter substrate-binding protein [Verrucomicrobiota bacterium]
MNRRPFIAMILAAPLVTRGAAAEEAQAALRSTIDEVLTIANRASSRSALANSVRSVLERRVSFETMTRRAVGVGWKQFSSAQQSKASSLFTTLVIRTYSNKFTPGDTASVDYKAATNPASGRVDVPTTVVYRGSRYAVTYRMEQMSGWKIADVVIEGVSLVANYRSQLDASFKQGGAEAVIRSLEQSVARPS